MLGGMIRLEARHGAPEVPAAREASAGGCRLRAEVYDHLPRAQFIR